MDFETNNCDSDFLTAQHCSLLQGRVLQFAEEFCLSYKTQQVSERYFIVLPFFSSRKPSAANTQVWGYVTKNVLLIYVLRNGTCFK